jgi:hypothetical protein
MRFKLNRQYVELLALRGMTGDTCEGLTGYRADMIYSTLCVSVCESECVCVGVSVSESVSVCKCECGCV